MENLKGIDTAENIGLKAKVDEEKRIAEAEGERDANLALAAGITAVGEAEAAVEALKREALYAGSSGKLRATVEIAKFRAEKLKGIFEGVNIVPEKTVAMFGNETSSFPKVTLSQE